MEIAPASGFLTFEMETPGAEVVSVEVTAERGWDFVPYLASKLEEVFGPRRIVMQRLKNSYWLSHAAQNSRARVYYGDVYNLPASLGEFDIAVMRSVLLHCRIRFGSLSNAGKKPGRSSLSTCFTQTWKERRYVVWRPRPRIFSGTPDSISAHNFSLNF